LGLLPSGPDPVGERYVRRQPPARYIGVLTQKGKGRTHFIALIDHCPMVAYFRHMSLHDIITLPDPLLRQTSKPVKGVDKATRKLFDDMLETMYDAPGIGLAAVQIGVPQRLVVIDLSKEDEERKPLFMANPEIISASEVVSDYEEGCLSIPDFYEMVTRPSEVKVRYLDRQGEGQELLATGVLATCIQHEIDHLNGVLFIDYISKLKRDRVVKKFVKAQKLGKL
jgi:peptide deformylase